MDPLLQKTHAFKIEPFDYEIFHDYSSYEITYENVSLTFRIVFVDASMNSGPRSCIYCAEFIWENINFSTLRNRLSISTHLQYCIFTSIAQLVSWKTTSTSTVSEIIGLLSDSSSKSVPTQNLANVMYDYVNHRPFEIWLRIRSFVKLSIYQSHTYR